MHIGRLEATGQFPIAYRSWWNTIAWFEDEIDAFIEEKRAERDAKTAARDANADPSAI